MPETRVRAILSPVCRPQRGKLTFYDIAVRGPQCTEYYAALRILYG